VCARVARPMLLGGPSASPLDGSHLCHRGALATTLRATFGALAGAVFALFVVAVPYDSFAVSTILVVTCVGSGIGAYLALRYGDRLIVWVLKFWNRSGE